MTSYAGQAILHAATASIVIEILLRAWRVEDPGERLALRWVAMLAPVVLTAGYVTLFPFRSAAWFAENQALFAGAHWDELRVGGVGVASAAAVALSLLGTALYLRDAVPFVADRIGRQAPETGLPDAHPACRRVRETLTALPDAGPGRPAVITVVDISSPVLLCSGIDRTAIVISTGTLDRLDDDQLSAALAHELAHLAARDPLMGWWLMTVRTLQFFNPAVHIMARQAVQELERRADIAVARRGQARALAGAVQRLSLAPGTHSDLTLPSDGGHLADRVLSSAHRHAIDDRCQQLLEDRPQTPRPFRRWRVGLCATALALLLFLVV